MAEKEKFSFKKFAISFFQLQPWMKNIRFVAGAVIIGFIGLTIYRAYFIKTTSQTQHADITVQPGGTLNYTPTQKVEGTKKKWYIPSPFVDIYVFTETDVDSRARNGIGARGGLRWEF